MISDTLNDIRKEGGWDSIPPPFFMIMPLGTAPKPSPKARRSDGAFSCVVQQSFVMLMAAALVGRIFSTAGMFN